MHSVTAYEFVYKQNKAAASQVQCPGGYSVTSQGATRIQMRRQNKDA